MGGDDHLLGAAGGDRIHRRQERVVVADFAGGRYSLCRQQRRREVDANLCRFAHSVVLDDESRRGLCLGHDEAERHIALRGACACAYQL